MAIASPYSNYPEKGWIHYQWEEPIMDSNLKQDLLEWVDEVNNKSNRETIVESVATESKERLTREMLQDFIQQEKDRNEDAYSGDSKKNRCKRKVTNKKAKRQMAKQSKKRNR